MLSRLSRIAAARDVRWVMMDQALVSGCNFLTAVVLARALGPNAFGVYSLLWTGVLLAVALHYSAVITPMMSLGPALPDDERGSYYHGAFSQHLVLTIGFTALAVLSTITGDQLVERDLAAFRTVIPLIVAAFVWQEYVRRYCFAVQRPRRAFVADLLRSGGQLVVVVAMWRMGISELSVMLWGIAICAALGSLPMIGLGLRWRHDSALWHRHLHFSKWMVGGDVVRWFSGNLFLVATGAVIGASAAGAFRAAQQLCGPLQILLQALANIIPVRLAASFGRGGTEALRQNTGQMTRVIAAVTLPVVALLAVAPEPLVVLFFGAEFAPYANLVPWFALATGLMVAGSAWRIGLAVNETTRPVFTIYVVTAALSIATAKPITENFGVLGAAIAVAALALIQQAYFAWAFYRSTRQERPS